MSLDASRVAAVPPSASRDRVWFVALLGLVVAAPAFLAWFSGNIWEDFFITYRCSLNLLHGNGLVYEAGQRVHAFTSPLGTLLPAALAWVARTDDPAVVMNLFRGCACVTLGVAWGLLGRRLLSGVGLILAGLFWAFDAKIAAFSTNGMETAWLLLAVVAAWRFLLERRPALAGVALGFALWTRPDGFVFFGAIAAGVFLLRGELPWRLRDWLVLAAVAAGLYLPWVLWAWSYYGSPVPNTILAKGAHLSAGESLRLLATYPWRFLFGHSAAHDAFLPPYFFFGGWPDALSWYGRILAVAAAGVACWPRCARPARVAGIAFVLGGVYLTITTRAPWYFPAWALLAYFAIAGGVAAAWESGRTWWRWTALSGAGLLLAGQLALFVGVTVQLRHQQRLIEWGLRAPLGRILKQSASSPHDTVFLESLGYIGFYSGLSMRDTPGLCAPDVVALRRRGVLESADLIAALQPDWVVLRGSEYAEFKAAQLADFDRHYQLRAVQDVRAEVAAVNWLPGRGFLLSDAYYGVWHRLTPGPKP